MPRHDHANDEPEYKTETMEQGRCPECGSEGNITRTQAVTGQPIPVDMAGECGDCGHTDAPITFRREYQWNNMSESERGAEIKRRKEIESSVVAYQESAGYHHTRTEP